MVDWKCKKEKYATNPVTRTEFSAESGHAVCACVRALWSKCFISSNGDRRVGEKRKKKKHARMKMICFYPPPCLVSTFVIFRGFLFLFPRAVKLHSLY